MPIIEKVEKNEIVEKFKYTQSVYKIKFYINANWKHATKEKKRTEIENIIKYIYILHICIGVIIDRIIPLHVNVWWMTL